MVERSHREINFLFLTIIVLIDVMKVIIAFLLLGIVGTIYTSHDSILLSAQLHRAKSAKTPDYTQFPALGESDDSLIPVSYSREPAKATPALNYKTPTGGVDAEKDIFTGTWVSGGIIGCHLIRLNDGRVATVVAPRGQKAEIGKRITFRGDYSIRYSTCQQGLQFHIIEVIDN